MFLSKQISILCNTKQYHKHNHHLGTYERLTHFEIESSAMWSNTRELDYYLTAVKSQLLRSDLDKSHNEILTSASLCRCSRIR